MRPGVFVAMQGKLIPADRVYKDYQRGVFGSFRWTPLTPLELAFQGIGSCAFLKREDQQITGSIKFRPARRIIAEAAEKGLIEPGRTILAGSSSGNFNHAGAHLAREWGYGFLAVLDPNCPELTVSRIAALGARIEMVSDLVAFAGTFLQARLYRVAEIVAQNPDIYFDLNQYSHPMAALAHCEGTAFEIDHQMRGDIDAIFLGVSTCATLAGFEQYYRHKSSRPLLIAVDEIGSIVFGERTRSRYINGLGSSRRPNFSVRPDEVIYISAVDAFAACHVLREQTGINVGGSSGSVIAAYAQALEQGQRFRRPVLLMHDSGDRYEQTIYSKDWLRARNLDLKSSRMSALEFRLKP